MKTNNKSVYEKITFSVDDIKTIMDCGKNTAYSIVNEAVENKYFVVKRIGNKFYIPSESFWAWYNDVAC